VVKNLLFIFIGAVALTLIIACNPIKPTQTELMEGMQHGAAIKAHAGDYKSIDLHLYTIKFNKPVAQTGQETSMEFKVTEKKSGKPVTELQIVHEKPMHIVIVRNDLKHFGHIHPTLKGGAWVTEYKFDAAGKYRIWTDFTKDGIQHIVDFDLSVSGTPEAAEQDSLYGLKVKIMAPEKITANAETNLDFVITDAIGNPIPITEKYLGANAHIITIDESLQEFDHTHDMKSDDDNVLSFKQTFSEPGKYRAWVQFLVNGKVRTASFDFMVSEGIPSQHNMRDNG
jgi:hypothetical protein